MELRAGQKHTVPVLRDPHGGRAVAQSLRHERRCAATSPETAAAAARPAATPDGVLGGRVAQEDGEVVTVLPLLLGEEQRLRVLGVPHVLEPRVVLVDRGHRSRVKGRQPLEDAILAARPSASLALALLRLGGVARLAGCHQEEAQPLAVGPPSDVAFFRVAVGGVPRGSVSEFLLAHEC